MSLFDFKKAASGESVWIAFRETNEKGKLKTVKKNVGTPLCTDDYNGFPGSDVGDYVEGEVICNAAPGNANQDQVVVAGGYVTKILYRFAGSRLYRIDISFPSIRYEVIKQAFSEKYGDPVKTSPEEFMNAFGARWQGENLVWRKGRQGIAIREGGNNGPGQDAFRAASGFAMFFDESLSPEAAVHSNVDF